MPHVHPKGEHLPEIQGLVPARCERLPLHAGQLGLLTDAQAGKGVRDPLVALQALRLQHAR